MQQLSDCLYVSVQQLKAESEQLREKCDQTMSKKQEEQQQEQQIENEKFKQRREEAKAETLAAEMDLKRQEAAQAAQRVEVLQEMLKAQTAQIDELKSKVDQMDIANGELKRALKVCD